MLGKYLNSEWFWLYIILGNTFAIIHSLIHCWNVYCINVNRVLFICIRVTVCLLPGFLGSVEIWLFNTFCVNLNIALKGILFTLRSRNTLHLTRRKQRYTNKRYYLPEIRLPKIKFLFKFTFKKLNLRGRAIKSIKENFQTSDFIQ